MRSSRMYVVDGIVLSRRNTGEADRYVTIFTRQYGKKRVLAKGVRKVSSRRGPHIEVFNRIDATIHTGRVDTLSEVTSKESFPSIRSDLARVGAAYYLCELIDGLLPIEQIHEDVFDLLVEALTTLGRVDRSRIELMRTRFAAALLKKLGFLETSRDNLDAYIEQLLERRLKTPRLASELNF